jgi:hypothetical protein
MANYIGRVLGGFSRTANCEHYIIEMISQVTGEPYRHQIFIDNTTKLGYHLIDGVDEMQKCSALHARFDVLKFALQSNSASQDLIDEAWIMLHHMPGNF